MKFKVGDRVRVYSRQAEKCGEIVEIACNGQLGIVFDPFIGNRACEFFHPKQCRKLIKKERRRIWIYSSEFADVSHCEGFTCLAKNPMVFTSREQIGKDTSDHLIEFVERRRK